MRCKGCNRRLIYGLNYNGNILYGCFSCWFPNPPVPIPPENLKKRGKVSLQQTDDGFCPICHKYITRKNWARHVRNMHNKYYKEHGGVFSNSFAGYTTTSTQEKPLFSLSFQNLRELNYENQERTSPSTSVLDVEVTKSFDIPSIQFMQDYYGEDRTFPQFSEELTEDRPPSSVTTSVIISSISDFLEERDVTKNLTEQIERSEPGTSMELEKQSRNIKNKKQEEVRAEKRKGTWAENSEGIKKRFHTTSIGIDIGTSYSSVGIYRNGKVEIIYNNRGNKKTPSVVSFTDTECLIGEQAVEQMANNLRNTIFWIKCMIGRKWDESKHDLRHVPFNLVNKEESLGIEVEFKGEKKTFLPEEIFAMLLDKMKKTAEAFLGCGVRDAVVTVPAYYNTVQRQAVERVGLTAGLVLDIITETSAAALAHGYRLEKRILGIKNILIFHLGGGTCNVSIFAVYDSTSFNLKATVRDAIGGKDIDNILEFFQINGHDITQNNNALHLLRLVSERVKCQLSRSNEEILEVASLLEGNDFSIQINRTEFELLCGPLFLKMLGYVKQALRNAKLEKTQINEIHFVGESTNIPFIKTILQKFFNNKEFLLNNDESIVFGAAIWAAMRSHIRDDKLNDLFINEVIPAAGDSCG